MGAGLGADMAHEIEPLPIVHEFAFRVARRNQHWAVTERQNHFGAAEAPLEIKIIGVGQAAQADTRHRLAGQLAAVRQLARHRQVHRRQRSRQRLAHRGNLARQHRRRVEQAAQQQRRHVDTQRADFASRRIDVPGHRHQERHTAGRHREGGPLRAAGIHMPIKRGFARRAFARFDAGEASHPGPAGRQYLAQRLFRIAGPPVERLAAHQGQYGAVGRPQIFRRGWAMQQLEGVRIAVGLADRAVALHVRGGQCHLQQRGASAGDLLRKQIEQPLIDAVRVIFAVCGGVSREVAQPGGKCRGQPRLRGHRRGDAFGCLLQRVNALAADVANLARLPAVVVGRGRWLHRHGRRRGGAVRHQHRRDMLAVEADRAAALAVHHRLAAARRLDFDHLGVWLAGAALHLGGNAVVVGVGLQRADTAGAHVGLRRRVGIGRDRGADQVVRDVHHDLGLSNV